MNGRMACCPRCWFGRDEAVPLIATFAFSRYEFYCLECGGKFDWLAPEGKEPTPALDARYEALLAEWNELAGDKLIGGGVMLTSCTTCTSTGEPHWNHATDEEKAEHEQALEALQARIGAAA